MKKNPEKQRILAKIDAIDRKLDKKKRLCFAGGCDKYAIDSHILQKNGIINSIAENKHVYQLLADTFRDEYYCFVKKGLNEAYTFKGFCGSEDNDHDCEIFKEIESNPGLINFDNYRSQLLFSYRSLLYKIREREITIEISHEWYKDFELRILREKIFGNQWYENGLKDYEISIKESIELKKKIEQDLSQSSSTQQYLQFHKIVIPRIDICCSQCFNYEINNDLTFAQLNVFESLTFVFLNIIPYKNQTIILIAYPKERANVCGRYFDAMLAMSEKDLKKRISDLLLIFGDDWLCSPTLYLKYLRHQEKNISKIIGQYKINRISRTVNYNIFDYIK